jgi:Tol biopolymer transport system component
VSRARRPRPAGAVAALGLALLAVAPASGALAPTPATPAFTSSRPPAAQIPLRPPPAGGPAALAPPPGATSVVSLDRGKGFADGPSLQPSISENGRWVAFASSAGDLVANDDNKATDVFLRDRRDGKTIRLPLPGGGAVPPQASATEPAISADGSAVAFTYTPPPPSPLLVVPCALPRVFVWHRASGATEIASIVDNELLCGSTSPSISGDGRLLAFVGPVQNASGVPLTQVFVRDLRAGTTILASAASSGPVGTSNSRAPAISRDGAMVAFESEASNLSQGDSNETTDVFVRTLPAGPTEIVSVVPGGTGNGPSNAPAVSADGSKVAFESGAQNLIAGPAPGAREVYVRDRTAGQTTLVSTSTGGAPATGASGQAAISGDGRVVAFASVVPDLVASGSNAILAAVAPPPPTEVYARDLVSGEMIRISEARAGGPAGRVNAQPTIGGNGRFVAFASNSENLVRGDANQVSDVFLRDLPPSPSIAPDPVDFGARAVGAEGPPIAAIVTNSGWSALAVSGVDRAGPAARDFTIAFNGCDGRTLRRGESCPITIVFAPGGAGERVATLTVDHNGPRPLTAGLHGSGSNAAIEIKPPSGRPGIVVIVTGSGFPANTELTLAWSRGLTPTMPAVRTDARGNFRAQVLVFHNDLIGNRDLVATPVGRASFPPFGTRFLVVESGGEPPRFEPGDPAANRPPTIIFRH